MTIGSSLAVSEPPALVEVGSRPRIGHVVPGIVALLMSAPLAVLIDHVHGRMKGQTDEALLFLGGVFAGLLALPLAVCLLVQRRSAHAGRLGLVVLGTVGVLLASIYVYRTSFFVLYPADILAWSESDFVNDILKFRVGYPIYSQEANNESFLYVPGAQLLTYALAWLIGSPTSIPVYRVIQVFYTLLAALVAFDCCRRLVELRFPSRQFCHWRLWSAVWLPIIFLIATNSLTNPYTHNLHNDALVQLVSVVAYWLLLRYVSNRDNRILALMAVIPAVGFFVKQTLAVWAVLYCIQLAVFDSPRSIKRLVGFALVAVGGVGLVLAGAYLLWEDHFVYWTVTTLAEHGVSPLRSFQHVRDVWPYYVIGLVGGAVLLRGEGFDRLLGPWVSWLLLILVQTYTSGVASMLNHIGPGCLIAGIWFVAALTRLWPLNLPALGERLGGPAWLRAGISVFLVGLVFEGLGIVRIPVRPVSEKDAYRYVREIEREFEAQSAEKILLDVGTWVYVRDGVIMKDRAPAIGERGYSQTGDFSGIIERLERKHYSKILVRNLHSPELWYDYAAWRKSSGIKKAMLDNYREIDRIKGVAGQVPKWVSPYGLCEVSILVPNQN
jgi:hypothetical protein